MSEEKPKSKGTKQMPIRLNEADRAALKRVAGHYGYRDAASLIRWIIHREDRQIAKEQPPVPPAAADTWSNLPPDDED